MVSQTGPASSGLYERKPSPDLSGAVRPAVTTGSLLEIGVNGTASCKI
jgi:hypothetical protein